MTVHARSDVAAVTIAPNHGGCGEVHSRPVVEGAPVKLWSLTCHNGCEDVLRKDAHWSATISGVPETPDEKAYREDQELKGKQDQQNQTAEALARLASLGDLPSAIAKLAEMFSGEPKSREIATLVTCTGCGFAHKNDAKFCPECGLRADVQVPKEAGGYGNHLPDLEELNLQQLKELATERGISVKGNLSRATVIDRLRSA